MTASNEILVVDDNPANLNLLSQILTSHGYSVRVAPNGTRALESVKLALPGLILLDVKMPHMSGYEVCESLKANELTRDIPIIFISALDDVQDKVHGFHAGGIDYVTKPFQMEEVLARVETHLKLYRLQQQLQENNERMTRELNLAGHMQANFMPHKLPQISGWDFAAALRPARETSGDFYDLFPLPDGKLGILIADVVDKGVAAALFMVLSWSLLRERASAYTDRPEQVLADVNRKIIEIVESLEFTTAFLGVLDTVHGQLIYANAGHNPPLLFCAETEQVTRLTRTGLPLGIDTEGGWTQATASLHPGDVLLLYTDGITEACNPCGVTFGLVQLQQSIAKFLQRPACELQQIIFNETQQFLQGETPQDDLTLMIIKRV